MRYPVESHNINSEKIQIIGCHYPVNSSGNSNLGPGLNESTGCLELVTCWWIFLEFEQSSGPDTKLWSSERIVREVTRMAL